MSRAHCILRQTPRKDLAPPPPSDPSGSDNYSFPLFLSYVLYPPLYLAGPIITYPSFLSQLSPPPPIPRDSSPSKIDETSFFSIVRYSFRFLSSLLTMEIILHTMYVVAIKDSGNGWWSELGPMQVSMIGFWNLIIVWLKVSHHTLFPPFPFTSFTKVLPVVSYK